MSSGLRATFDREFEGICNDLVAMSQKVDFAIECAMQALKENDIDLAEQVVHDDVQVNELRFKIEEACLVLIATQQPAASDLRAVVAAIHVAVELERMADHAAGIAKTVVMMNEEPLLKTLKKLPKMGELVRKMVQESIQAFLARDAEKARQVALADEKIDHLYKAVFSRLVEIMARKPVLVTRATYLMWCAHNLERIADRTTNIAERVIFITTGEIKEFSKKALKSSSEV